MKAIIDCNSFYAACERVFQPSLASTPIVVLSNNDGCVISRSDEAKKLGIKMAGPFYQVKGMMERKEVAVFSSNYRLYGDMSWRVMETLKMLSPNVEVYSVDESFLDLQGMHETNLHGFGCKVRDTVELYTGIPVSVGIAPTKVLAKVANKLAKENKHSSACVKVLSNIEEQEHALRHTRIEEVWGIGKQNAAKLVNLGITSAWELRNMPEDWAQKNLGGVVGVRLIRELKGIPCIELKDQLDHKKMIATTRMFGRPVSTLEELKESIATYASRAAEKLRRQKSSATVLHVFVVKNDYNDEYDYNPQQLSLMKIMPVASSNTNEIIHYAIPLVEELYKQGSRYLKTGIILSGLVPEDCVQTNIFEPASAKELKKLMHAVDNVNASMGQDMISFASSGIKKAWKMRQDMRSPRYSSNWEEMKNVG